MLTYKRPIAKQASHHSLTRKTDNQIRVFGYCRVSTDMQAAQGLSLDDQREAIKQCAADRGWVVEEIFVDGGFSAKNTDRPAFQRMVREIKNSDGAISAVLVTKLDRLTRSLRDLCSINEDLLEPYSCNLVAIRDGINTFEPVSKMLLPFLAIIGQIERQNTSERCKATIRHIQEQGGFHGKVPFGFTKVADGKLKRLGPCPNTHPWLERLVGWYHEGVGMSEIARRLNEAGVQTFYGQSREWTKHKIYELLRTMELHKGKTLDTTATHDQRAAYRIAYRLRAEGRFYREIADELNRQNLRPKNAAKYTESSAKDVIRSAVYLDRRTARGFALYLKEQGHSLREIALRLAQAGHHPKRGGQWYANSVKLLLLS